MDELNSNDLLYAAAIINIIKIIITIKKKNAKRRRVWSKPWLQRRMNKGTLNLLNKEFLYDDSQAYKNCLRVTNVQLQHLLSLITKDITKQDTFMRDAISAQSRLEVTLRFLATGETYRSLMYSTKIHESTISRFVPEVCAAIFKNLKNKYLQIPKSADAWKNIADEFYSLWQFPHCLGALDGRHISFKPPISDGSFNFNYKGFHSIVLIGLCDAKYKFTYINVGVNGCVSDGGLFQQTTLAKVINNQQNPLNFPSPEVLPGRHTLPVPYVIIADDAFPLSNQLMKPYPQRGLTKDRKIYNYCLNRARRTIESCFGILANRFRVLLNPIHLSADEVEKVVLATVVLHNYLISHQYSEYTAIDSHESECNKLKSVSRQGGNNSTRNAQLIRNEFKEFFNSIGAVEWQKETTQRNNL